MRTKNPDEFNRSINYPAFTEEQAQIQREAERDYIVGQANKGNEAVLGEDCDHNVICMWYKRGLFKNAPLNVQKRLEMIVQLCDESL